ncbi:hypothetical protein AVEN_216728-1, partial [Araneus ventricosus]
LLSLKPFQSPQLSRTNGLLQFVEALRVSKEQSLINTRRSVYCYIRKEKMTISSRGSKKGKMLIDLSPLRQHPLRDSTSGGMRSYHAKKKMPYLFPCKVNNGVNIDAGEKSGKILKMS